MPRGKQVIWTAEAAVHADAADRHEVVAAFCQQLRQHPQTPVHDHGNVKDLAAERFAGGLAVERIGMDVANFWTDELGLVPPRVQDGHFEAAFDEPVDDERTGGPGAAHHERCLPCGHCVIVSVLREVMRVRDV